MNGRERDEAGRQRGAPPSPMVMAQTWSDLLFAHWPVPFERLRALVPEPLVLEEFDGSAWVGVVPFRITGLRPRGVPARLGLDFPELNVRTYVSVGGRPGVYFFSLDAGSQLAVWGARTFFRLPYHHAEMDVSIEGEWVRYRSRRLASRRGAGEFRARYRPAGDAFTAAPGTLEHFLTERYCLYAVLGGGRVLRVDIDHVPWPLQRAEAEIETNTMAAASGIALPDRPPLLHFSRRLDVVNGLPVRVGSGPAASSPRARYG